MGIAGHMTIRWEGLGASQSVGRGNGRGGGGCRGLSGTVVNDPPQGWGMMRLGWKEIKPPINGLRVGMPK